MPSIRRMGIEFSADRRITRAEAEALVAKARADGSVRPYEKSQLRQLMAQYRDLFDPGALDLLRSVAGGPTPPPAAGRAVPLDRTGAHRPVFLNADGVFTTDPAGSPPRNDVELGDALFRAAELADDAAGNVLMDAQLPRAAREKVFANVQAALAKVPAAGRPPAGLDDLQAKQLRASAATVLQHLLEATSEPDLQLSMARALQSLVKAETVPQLKDSMIFHLHAAGAARTPEVKAISDEMMRDLAPLYPPYDAWFANGNKGVNLSWTVGEGEFWKGFTNKLKSDGFRPVGAENEHGVSTYEKAVNKPGVGETTFRISVRQGGTNIFSPMGDPNVHIVGYDGHSNWGRNMSSSVKNGPESANGGEAKLVFSNLCVGKGALNKVHDKYPNAQVVTTYAASNFYTDAQGQMTTGEGVQSLLAMVDSIAERAPWTRLHKRMNDAADIGSGRTWDNYVTPISTMVREKVLDRDHDGQADYLDKLVNFNVFRVPEDTRREFSAVDPGRPANVLDGTQVLMAGNMINTLSEFSQILDRVNPDSKVVPEGYFAARPADREVIRFTKVTSPEGKPIYRMQVNAGYAHMSEDALRLVTVYEFNRYLSQTSQLNLDPVSSKLNGLLLAAHSLRVDEGYRDGEVWSAFLRKYGFPEIDMGTVSGIVQQDHHFYAGSDEGIRKLRAALPPEVIEALKRSDVGEPTAPIS